MLTGLEEVRTRLRPHRSSWRERFSLPERKSSNTSIKPVEEIQQVIKTKCVEQSSNVKPTGSSSKWNYPSEDVASIARNLHLPLKREKSPDSTSKLQKKSKHCVKRRGRPPLSNASKTIITVEKKINGKKRSRTPSTEAVLLKVQKKTQPELKEKKIIHASSQQNVKIVNSNVRIKAQEAASSQSVNLNKKRAPERPKILKPVRPAGNHSDSRGYCEICKQEFMYLQWHLQTKHKTLYGDNSFKAKNIAEGVPMKDSPNKCTVPVESSKNNVEREMLPDDSSCRQVTEEAVQIAKTVEGDVLIQQFGVRLLGMSLDPEQKILAVSQRMIELVRLLRAAQGFEPALHSLSDLLLCDHWPLITQAIHYVAGYQPDTNTFRNPGYVFDIGQAMKFAAHILKNEAASNMNSTYEQQLKDFMNSINVKIDEILPNAFQYRIDSDTTENNETVKNIDISETNQLNSLITTYNGESNPQAFDEILPGVIRVAETVAIESTYDATSRIHNTQTNTSPEKCEGERQASLLLELSRACSSVADTASVSQIQTSQPDISQLKVITTPTLNSSSIIKTLHPLPASSSSTPSKTTNVSGTNIRIVKIVSTQNSQGQKRKLCLLIPSQTVPNSKLAKSLMQWQSPASQPVVMQRSESISEPVPPLTVQNSKLTKNLTQWNTPVSESVMMQSEASSDVLTESDVKLVSELAQNMTEAQVNSSLLSTDMQARYVLQEQQVHYDTASVQADTTKSHNMQSAYATNTFGNPQFIIPDSIDVQTSSNVLQANDNTIGDQQCDSLSMTLQHAGYHLEGQDVSSSAVMQAVCDAGIQLQTQEDVNMLSAALQEECAAQQSNTANSQQNSFTEHTETLLQTTQLPVSDSQLGSSSFNTSDCIQQPRQSLASLCGVTLEDEQQLTGRPHLTSAT